MTLQSRFEVHCLICAGRNFNKLKLELRTCACERVSAEFGVQALACEALNYTVPSVNSQSDNT